MYGFNMENESPGDNRRRLDGQVVLVTGASRGIGRAIAVRCAAAGASVALTARSQDKLEETAAHVRDAGSRALVLPGDVTDYGQVRAVVARTESELGAIHTLVNDAGRLAAIGPTWETEPGNWWQDVTVNLLGVYHFCRAAIPGMIERGSGRVINFAGGGAGKPFEFASAYGSSKAAIVRFTETLAAELEQVEAPVKVFAISPGFVRTAMTEQFAKKEPGRKWMSRLVERLKAGDDVSPENAAAMVVVLASGLLDKLAGRYLRSPEDIQQIEALRSEAAGIVEQEERVLRIT